MYVPVYRKNPVRQAQSAASWVGYGLFYNIAPTPPLDSVRRASLGFGGGVSEVATIVECGCNCKILRCCLGNSAQLPYLSA